MRIQELLATLPATISPSTNSKPQPELRKLRNSTSQSQQKVPQKSQNAKQTQAQKSAVVKGNPSQPSRTQSNTKTPK